MSRRWRTKLIGAIGAQRRQVIGLVLIIAVVSMAACDASGNVAGGTTPATQILCDAFFFFATKGVDGDGCDRFNGRNTHLAYAGIVRARAGQAAVFAHLQTQHHVAEGRVAAPKVPAMTLDIPLRVLAEPGVSSATITVGVNLFDKKLEPPKKQFKSITVELRVKGKIVGKGSGNFDKTQGSASVEFEGLKLAAKDVAEATVKLTGGQVVDTTILAIGAAAGEE